MTALFRTLTLTTVLGAIVLLIFWRVGFDQKQKAIDELTALNAQLEAQVKQREEMVQRLSRTRRIAHIEIVDQRTSTAPVAASLAASSGRSATAASGAVTETDLRFIELDDNGREIGRQKFTVPGQVLFVDAWTVKFDHEHVAEGHPMQGRSLVLLRRIYSDLVPPRDGFAIDLPGAVPPGYAGNDMSRFEQQLWAHFWELATNAQLARQMGVRVAQGEVVYKPVKVGQQFELIVDASGGMSLRPLDQAEMTRVTK